MRGTKIFYPMNINADEFAKKHGIEPFESPCPECGNNLITNRPFRTKDYAGLESVCKCGKNNGCPYTVVAVSKEMKSLFDRIF